MEALDQFLLTTDSTNNEEPPVLVPITPTEFQLVQGMDPFCTGTRERLIREKCVPFNTNYDTSLIFRTQPGDQQLMVPSSLRDRVLRVTHYGKLSGHPVGVGYINPSNERSIGHLWPQIATPSQNIVRLALATGYS